MDIQPIQVQSLKQACIDQLEQMILSGELKIGERLPSEREFAARLNVSRPVLHQALVELETRGLVDIVPRRGVYISDFRREGSLAMLSSLLNYHNGSLGPDFSQSMLDMRQLLETETARLAAQNRTDEQLEWLKYLLDREMAATGDSPEALTAFDFEFHLSIAICSGNLVYPMMINSFKEVYTSLTGIFFQEYFSTGVVADVHHFHIKLVDAIADQDPDTAAQTMSEMLMHGEGYLKGVQE
jgi:DNA-binding FadR family transcriptional regulator